MGRPAKLRLRVFAWMYGTYLMDSCGQCELPVHGFLRMQSLRTPRLGAREGDRFHNPNPPPTNRCRRHRDASLALTTRPATVTARI